MMFWGMGEVVRFFKEHFYEELIVERDSKNKIMGAVKESSPPLRFVFIINNARDLKFMIEVSFSHSPWAVNIEVDALPKVGIEK